MILITIAVRLKSQRLPKKALADIEGQTLIMRLTERVARSGYKPVWCTSWEQGDNPLAQLARWNSIMCYRGSPSDVMQRFLDVAKREKAEHIVRVTGDNPLTDPGLIRRMIEEHIKADANYTRVIGPPKGTKPEIIRVSALEELHKGIQNPQDSEYMTPMLELMDKIVSLELKGEGCDPNMRLTVDYPADLERVRKIYKAFHGNPPMLPDLTMWVKNNLTDYYSTGLTELSGK